MTDRHWVTPVTWALEENRAKVTVPGAHNHGYNPEGSSPRHGGSAEPHLVSAH